MVAKKFRSRFTACLAFGLVIWPAARHVPAASSTPDLSGTWQLNRGQSEFPSEVAFGPQWQDTSQPASGVRSGGGGGRRSRGGPGGSGGLIPSLTARPESEEDTQKIDQLMDEVKNPAATLAISQTEGMVTISDTQGVSRTFRTTGKEQVQQLKAGPMITTSTWESGKLVVDYHIEKDRRVRYTYARPAGQPQLQVDAQLLEKGKGTPIKRIYDHTLPD